MIYQRKINRMDDKDAMANILEFLRNTDNEWATVHSISTKGFKKIQKESRISYLLKILVDNGFVESKTMEDNRTRYKITKKGNIFYLDKLNAVINLFKQ